MCGVFLDFHVPDTIILTNNSSYLFVDIGLNVQKESRSSSQRYIL
jgi:hypothetical protein